MSNKYYTSLTYANKARNEEGKLTGAEWDFGTWIAKLQEELGELALALTKPMGKDKDGSQHNSIEYISKELCDIITVANIIHMKYCSNIDISEAIALKFNSKSEIMKSDIRLITSEGLIYV